MSACTCARVWANPAEGEAELKEERGENAGEGGPSGDGDAGDEDDLAAGRAGVEVAAVDVVGNDGAHPDLPGNGIICCLKTLPALAEPPADADDACPLAPA